MPLPPFRLRLMPEAKKQCPVCASTKPISCFDEDPGAPGQRVDLCKDCISEMLTKSLRVRSMETSARNDEVIRRGLESELLSVQPMGADGDYCPDVSTVTGEIMRLFGGPRGYARTWMAVFMATDPESHSRVKMLSEMRAMVEKTTEEGKAKTLESMSDEELRAHRERLMKSLMLNLAASQMSSGQVGKFSPEPQVAVPVHVVETTSRIAVAEPDDESGIDMDIGGEE